MKKALLLLTCSACLMSSALLAQKTMTLEQCLQYASANNIQLQQSQLNTSLAEIQLLQDKINIWPNLNGRISHGYNFGRSINPVTNEFESQNLRSNSLGLSSSVDLFGGWQKWRNIEQSQLELQKADLDAEAAYNDLALNIVGAYLEILKNEGQLEVLKQQTELTIQQQDRTSKMIRAGVLPSGDILEVRAQLASDSLNLINGQNLVELSYLNLSQLLDYYEPYNIVSPEIALPSTAEIAKYAPEKVYVNALNSLPEIKASELNVKSAKKGLQIAKSLIYPTLTLSGSMATNYASIVQELKDPGTTEVPLVVGYVGSLNGEAVFNNFEVPVSTETRKVPFFTQLDRNLNFNLGLNLNIPIFNNFSVRNNIRRSELNVKSADLQLEAEKRALLQKVHQAYFDAKAAAGQYEAGVSNLTALERAFENITKKYELGAANNLEFTSARNNLAIARLNLNSAKFNYIFKLKVLEYYQGRPIN